MSCSCSQNQSGSAGMEGCRSAVLSSPCPFSFFGRDFNILFFFSYIYRKVLDNMGGKKGIWGRGKG